MKTILFFLSATWAFCSTLGLGSFPHTKVEGETRVWTSKSGQTIKAEAKTLEGKSIQILRSDGRFFWVDFKDLSDEDILYLKKILPAPFTIFEAVPNARYDELKIRLENRGNRDYSYKVYGWKFTTNNEEIYSYKELFSGNIAIQQEKTINFNIGNLDGGGNTVKLQNFDRHSSLSKWVVTLHDHKGKIIEYIGGNRRNQIKIKGFWQKNSKKILDVTTDL